MERLSGSPKVTQLVGVSLGSQLPTSIFFLTTEAVLKLLLDTDGCMALSMDVLLSLITCLSQLK